MENKIIKENKECFDWFEVYDKANKKEKERMFKNLRKETNEKFRDRVLIMLLDTCGCDKKRAIEVLKLCLRKLKNKEI